MSHGSNQKKMKKNGNEKRDVSNVYTQRFKHPLTLSPKAKKENNKIPNISSLISTKESSSSPPNSNTSSYSPRPTVQPHHRDAATAPRQTNPEPPSSPACVIHAPQTRILGGTSRPCRCRRGSACAGRWARVLSWRRAFAWRGWGRRVVLLLCGGRLSLLFWERDMSVSSSFFYIIHLGRGIRYRCFGYWARGKREDDEWEGKVVLRQNCLHVLMNWRIDMFSGLFPASHAV